MSGKLNHLREQLADAHEQRLELAHSMILASQGSDEARRMFKHAIKVIRRRTSRAVPKFHGATPEVAEQLQIALYASMDSVANGGWPQK